MSHPQTATAQPLTLVCFAHSGGGSARYSQWRPHLPRGVRLLVPVLPGRESRFAEAPLTSVEAVTRDALGQIDRAGIERIALVGLSFGATVAYELAAQLEAAGRTVEALFVASQRAPSAPLARECWHDLDDATLLARLIGLAGPRQPSPGEIELLTVFLPTVRADLQASERYRRPDGRPRLRCPIHLYLGRHDPAVSADDAAAWREESAALAQCSLDAGHFLMHGDSDLWWEALRPDLERLQGRPPAGSVAA